MGLQLEGALGRFPVTVTSEPVLGWSLERCIFICLLGVQVQLCLQVTTGSQARKQALSGCVAPDGSPSLCPLETYTRCPRKSPPLTSVSQSRGPAGSRCSGSSGDQSVSEHLGTVGSELPVLDRGRSRMCRLGTPRRRDSCVTLAVLSTALSRRPLGFPVTVPHSSAPQLPVTQHPNVTPHETQASPVPAHSPPEAPP